MTLIRLLKPWQLKESQVTDAHYYFNRRSLLKGMLGAGAIALSLPLTGCQKAVSADSLEATLVDLPELKNIPLNPNFAEIDRPITDRLLAAQYNNYYEFGGSKKIWPNAQKLPTEPWKVEVTGLVKYPQTYDLADLKKAFPLEERIYRFRCVEAWSMALPWIGFPMKALLQAVEPTAQAKYARFVSFFDPQITKGPSLYLGSFSTPYQEALRIEEMANDLAFLAVGIYGHELPKQHGAPVRMVVPWKYGFKGGKAIVKIDFVAEQPATYWNTRVPGEYDFEANVNPSKPHPRWSQATEKFISTGPDLSWEVKDTLPYNGYGEYVASLY